jgi:hypothetical protein
MLTCWSALILMFTLFLAGQAEAQPSPKPMARYVLIELPGSGRTLSLAEVEVYSGQRNVAPRGSAIQSSTHLDASAARANDGYRSGHYCNRSVSHTQNENNPWWKLDLGAEQAVTKLVVYNRTDCCRERINPARIQLVNQAGEIVWNGAIESVSGRYEFDPTRPSERRLPISPNLLRNASFRQRTNPPIPDFWDLHHAAALTFKNLYDQYGVEEKIESPVAGTKVLKITNSEDDFSHLMFMPRRQFAGLAEGCYTFSVYLRSDRRGTVFRVTPAFGRGEHTARELSTSWKRYSATFRYSGSASDMLQPVLYFPNKGTYYIAAPQLERGRAPGPFQDAYDDSNPGNMQTTGKRESRDLTLADNTFSKKAPISATFEYNYYTSDPVARLRVGSGSDSDAQVRVGCEDVEHERSLVYGPKIVDIAPGSSVVLDVPAGNLAPGNYRCSAEPAGKGNKTKSAAAGLKKLVPGSVEVRINNFRHILTVNNRPFHIIGMAVGSWKHPPDWYLADLVSRGINTVYCTFPLDAEGRFTSAVEAFLASANRHGLKVVVGIPLSGVKPHDWRERLQGFLTLVKSIKSDPAVIGWWPVDEPADGSWNNEDYLEIYRSIKEIDPYRLVLVNWSSDSVPSKIGMEPRGTLNYTDLYSIDYYPFTGRRPDTNIGGFSATTVRMGLTSRLHDKIPHSWIQIFGGGDAWREPTGDEITYMVYLNLLFGGMTSYWDTKSNCSATWERISLINRQVGTLAETLFLDADTQQVVPPRTGKGFYYAVWRNGKKFYAVVLNSGTGREEFELDIHEFVRNHRPYADSLFEKRRVPLESGRIKDVFGPLESRVYVLESK